jgi:integrase/recombinase XerC
VPHGWHGWAEEKRYGRNTIDAYETDLDDYTSFLATQPDSLTASPNRTVFRGWIASMASRNLARTTIARRVSALRSFLRFTSRQNLLDVPDLSWLRAPRPPRTVPKSLSVDDAQALLAAIFARRGDDWIKARDFAVLMLLYGAGLRISEALSLQRRDAPLGDWLSITGKGNKIRDIPILRAAAEAVDEYIDLVRLLLMPINRCLSAVAAGHWAHARCNGLSNHFVSSLTCLRMSRRTPCVMPLLRICLAMVVIYARFSNYWVMPVWQQHSFIRMLMKRILSKCIRTRIHAPNYVRGFMAWPL